MVIIALPVLDPQNTIVVKTECLQNLVKGAVLQKSIEVGTVLQSLLSMRNFPFNGIGTFCYPNKK